MYEVLIKEYLKRLNPKEITEFASKNGMPLVPGEEKIIYDFIMNNWKQVYKGDAYQAFNKIKPMISSNTYNNIIMLYNEFKDKIK